MTKKDKLSWTTEQRRIDELIPFDKNPRKISNEQKKKLQQSLEEFDLVEIPVIDKDDKIIAGHQRIKILKMLGKEENVIDVRVPSRKLTDKEYKKYLISSNRNHADFDFDFLQDYEPDLLIDSGFEENELEEIYGHTKEVIMQHEEELKPYKQLHVLISIDMSKIKNSEDYMVALFKKLKDIDGVEVEQSAN